MARGERFRSREYYTKRAPSHSWIHAGWFSRDKKGPEVYLLCTPHGPLTVKEEYFCWIYAVTGKYRMSRRMAYGRPDTNVISQKHKNRIKDLLEMHDDGLIDLAKGPWEHYKLKCGDPTAFEAPKIKDYMPNVK